MPDGPGEYTPLVIVPLVNIPAVVPSEVPTLVPDTEYDDPILVA